MRNFKLIPALVILLVLPTLAAAGTLESLSGTADCETWAADLTVSFRPGIMMSRIEWSVVLQDAAGIEVDRFEFAEFIQIPAEPTKVYSFAGTWNPVLDGDYKVTGSFSVFDVFDDGFNETSDSFVIDLACGSVGTDPVGEPCVYSARYWADHPGTWPFSSIEINGRTFDQAAMMQILDGHRHRLMGFALIRQLIAARLNLANGSADDILPLIAETEDYLASRVMPPRDNRTSQALAMRLKAALLHYNQRGCPDAEQSGVTMSLGDDFAGALDKGATEVMSLGSLKAMYH